MYSVPGICGVIVPIDTINRCSAIGGFAGYLETQKLSLGKSVLYDEYLCSIGTMGPLDNEKLFDFWIAQGLEPFKSVDGQESWNDFCIVDVFSGPTLPCDWIEFEQRTDEDSKGLLSLVRMKGKPKGKIVSCFDHLNKTDS